MSDAPDLRLLPTWADNADAWTHAVREGLVPSRRAGTDAAVVEAVVSGLLPAGRVLDVGCGEGWLVRALGALGVTAHGVDACGPLVEAAREAGGGTFEALAYEDAAESPALLGGPYDAAVFNFSLLGERVVGVLAAARRRLEVGGRVIVQTAHPVAAGPPYADGWREETFADFEGDFTPMPWYFRTFGSWVRVLDAAGLRLAEAKEPVHPETGAPLSLLLVAEPVG